MSKRKEILKQLAEGKSKEEIAAQLGCTESYVYRLAQHNGFTMNHEQTKMEQIIELRKKGYSPQEIEEMADTTLRTVYSTLSIAGLTTPQRILPDEEFEKLMDKHSPIEISKILKISSRTAYKRIRQIREKK